MAEMGARKENARGSLAKYRDTASGNPCPPARWRPRENEGGREKSTNEVKETPNDTIGARKSKRKRPLERGGRGGKGR